MAGECPCDCERCCIYRLTLVGLSEAIALPHKLMKPQEKGLVYIDPVENDKIMAGQGTIGLEILETLPDVDAIYVPVGGGGLISGISTAVKECSPRTRVIGVEPVNMNCMGASCAAGKIVKIERKYSIADGLAGDAPGPKAFSLASKYVDDMITVTEDEIAKATILIMQRAKMFVEPSAAVSLAGLLSKQSYHGKKNVCILTGGNADLEVLAKIFEGALHLSKCNRK